MSDLETLFVGNKAANTIRAGFNVGKIDGIMGQASRSAVKAMQIKDGLPADSWPTAELLAKMRGDPSRRPI